jgi:hypothetical protein
MDRKKYFLVFFVSVLFFAGSTFVVNADVAIIQPSVADSRVQQDNPVKNYGSSTFLQVRSKEADNMRSYVKFDLSSIPPGAIVTSATLKLYMYDAPGESRLYEIRRIMENWAENEITWNNQPSVSPNFSIAVTGTTDGVWLSWDVTSDAQNFYSGILPNYGWRIADVLEDSSIGREAKFRSREYTDNTSLRPILEVEYFLQPTCGIYLSTSNLDFGSVVNGLESLEQTLSIANSGYTTATLSTYGTDWSAGPLTLPVSRTGFSTFSGNFSSKAKLSTSPQVITDSLSGGSSIDTYWQFKPEYGDSSGSYSQTITFTLSC